MATKQPKTPPKISVRIWEPLVKQFDSAIRDSCLRRDAYLDAVLAVEVPRLDAEVSLPNSLIAQTFIAARLDALERKLVSFTLKPELIERLNAICERKRIVRDAFFNRLYMLLTAKAGVIDRLMFAGDDEWRTEVWSERRNDGPFFQNCFHPLRGEIDPLWAIRTGREDARKGLEAVTNPSGEGTIQVERGPFHDGIRPPSLVYTVSWNDQFKNVDLTGFNCYLPDWEVPGTPEQVAFDKSLDDILAL